MKKTVLLGIISFFAALAFGVWNAHQDELSFASGYFAWKNGDFAEAAKRFSRISGSGSSERLSDMAKTALGAALTESGKTFSGTEALSFESNFPEIEALRLYDLGNAEAGAALSFTGESRKMGLLAALSAYSGAYAESKDPDALHNYREIEKLLEKETSAASEEESESEEEEGKKGSGRQSSGTSGKTGSGSDAQKDGKGEASKDGKGESQKTGSGRESTENSGSGSDSANAGAGKTWSNAGDPRWLSSDPSNLRAGSGSVDLSEIERQELESELKNLSNLQSERMKYLRPDGIAPDPNGKIPSSIRDMFQGDPFFESLLPDESSGKKNW